MIAILCKSDALGKELARISGSDPSCLRGPDQVPPLALWLPELLGKNPVSIVFYESCFFVDPAPFRSVSPDTRFVFLSDPEDQDSARRALACGASAVIAKPFTEQDVLGVLSLVRN